ncbi:hypothetical protein LJ739_14355 [Aestuariibacter halophilus]|uniref:Uncharacterized protein n=1 Tax=Fluctibacter halophilus TaxID=226011 RepID=A0ABS8GDZ5_9ALTE|nr:hypothetical protein [Aestuariibacter halophilus]MCC2617431.1 hypothetical protein [Aestuariibacter halophilus]
MLLQRTARLALPLMGILWVSGALAEPASTTDMQTSACPTAFHDVPLHPDARWCQSFDDSLPASLSHFVPQQQQQVIAFYQQSLGDAERQQTVHGRTLLQYSGGQFTIVVSDDGQGAQVDILVREQVITPDIS